jgi:uncharacterized membrane protein
MMFMMLGMVLAPLSLVGLMVVAAEARARPIVPGLRVPGKPISGAREILARRYAQGEISKDQYDQALADIAN